MKKTLLISALVFYFGIKANAQTTLFSQDFSAGGVVADYVDGSASDKFTAIVSGNTTTSTPSITNNALRVVKTTAGSASNNPFYAIRTSGFGSANIDLVQCKFNYTVSNASLFQTSPNVNFLIGSTITGDAVVGTNFHSRIAITHSSTTVNSWFVSGNGATTPVGTLYSGTQTITLVANNSGASKSYIAPDGSTVATVGDDRFDIWVGNNLEVNEGTASATTSTLSSFKFTIPGQTLAGTFDFDNISITSLPLTLPISLTSFTGKAVDQNVLLNWETASEQDNDYFEVLRSADGKKFTVIAKVDGAGNSTSVKNYSLVDENPFAGTNYYKLIQHDFDGKTSESDVISVNSKIAASQLSVYANPSDVKITLSSANNTKGKLQLFDISGRKLSETLVEVNKGYNTFSLPATLQNGIHVLRYTTESEIINQKFLK
jgi:hypothetical protein